MNFFLCTDEAVAAAVAAGHPVGMTGGTGKSEGEMACWHQISS